MRLNASVIRFVARGSAAHARLQPSPDDIEKAPSVIRLELAAEHKSPPSTWSRKKRKKSSWATAVCRSCLTLREIRPIQVQLEHRPHRPHLPVLHPLADSARRATISRRRVLHLHPILRALPKLLQPAFSSLLAPHSARRGHRAQPASWRCVTQDRLRAGTIL